MTKRVEIISTQLRVARCEFAVAKVGEKINIFGGNVDLLQATDSVEIFDLNTEQIEQGVKFPFKDYGFTACVL